MVRLLSPIYLLGFEDFPLPFDCVTAPMHLLLLSLYGLYRVSPHLVVLTQFTICPIHRYVQSAICLENLVRK
jgi:hypothetical protein